MIREPNIIEHLPLFMQEYREIKEIMTAENPEFKLVIDESEVIKNNQFIVSCDSDGIKRFEKILGISATEQEPLQSRIARVLMRWNDTVPYTFEAFIEKLKTICGEDYTVTEKFKEYKIEIETHLDQYGEVDELEYLLQYIMPSNIEVVSKNNWYFNMVGKLGIAAGLVVVNYFELSNDFKENFIINGAAKIGTGMIDFTMTRLTNDSQEIHDVQGTLNFGGGTVGTVECVITDNFQETININSDVNMGAGVEFVSVITT